MRTLIKPTIFAHASFDDWNRATDSVTGKHLDIVNVVLFQDSKAHSENSGDVEVADRTRKRSVGPSHFTDSSVSKSSWKNRGPVHLKAEVSIEWFFQCSRDHDVSRQLDIAWVFLRLCPRKLFDIDF